MGKPFDFLIVGAGLYGATFAQQATERGKKCLMIDRRDHVAGNAFTQVQDDVAVHRYGAHIFHTDDDAVWMYVNRFARFRRYTNAPLASYNGELYNLPFNMNTFRQMWGVRTPEEARRMIDSQRGELDAKQPKNLEEQAIQMVGRDIYEKLVKGYTEKQ